MAFRDIALIVSFIAAVIGIFGALRRNTIRLHNRYRWIEKMVVYLSALVSKERSIQENWQNGLGELKAIDTKDAALYSITLNGMPRIAVSDKPLEWMSSAAVTTGLTKHEVNKTHAFAVGHDFRTPGEHTVLYVKSDYDMVEAARSAGIKPPIISCNAIVFCPVTTEILLHIRSERTRSYPGDIHFLGGNYEPAANSEDFDDCDDVSPLRYAALREVREESGLKLDAPLRAIVFVGEELSTGFVQFTYAGLAIPVSKKTEVRPSREGAPCFVTLDDLVDFSKSGLLKGHQRKMVPSCALALLMWLRLGAPDQNRNTPMRDRAIKAYWEILPRIGKHLAHKSGT